MSFPWIILGLLTIIRLFFAGLGHFSETESYLLLCSHHLDWGFVEGPAGVPALIHLSGLLKNSTFIIRSLSPLLLLGSSWILWRWVSELCNQKIAFWVVLIFNLLPLANAAGVVMDGTMVSSFCWLIALWVGWRLITNKIQKNTISSWLIFGLILALGTQLTYQVGWLLPIVVLGSLKCFHHQYENSPALFSWQKLLGVVGASSILALAWLPVFWWNQQHDWLQFQNFTWDSFWVWPPLETRYFQQLSTGWCLLVLTPLVIAGLCCFFGIWDIENPFFLMTVVPFFFCLNELGHQRVPFALLLVLTVFFLPIAATFFLQTEKRKMGGLFLTSIFGVLSFLLLLGKIPSSSIQESAWNFPSARGVIGTETVAEQLTKLRATYANTSGRPPFLVAETPGLAAILGAILPVDYPERPGAPSVFIPESPALTSQFQLWPNYADATTENTNPDPLYTEEKAISPFLGGDAFYITTEKLEEIPQTITGAFASVVPLSFTFTLFKNGKRESLNLYLCQNYQMLSL